MRSRAYRRNRVMRIHVGHRRLLLSLRHEIRRRDWRKLGYGIHSRGGRTSLHDRASRPPRAPSPSQTPPRPPPPPPPPPTPAEKANSKAESKCNARAANVQSRIRIPSWPYSNGRSIHEPRVIFRHVNDIGIGWFDHNGLTLLAHLFLRCAL